VHALSELGVILLMFSLGLEFSLRKLFARARTAASSRSIQCALLIWLGYVVGPAVRLDDAREPLPGRDRPSPARRSS
jgi:Kef-type K+ transport system membrane component KefB